MVMMRIPARSVVSWDEKSSIAPAYLNNRLEQDHRAVKQRYYPMRGFGSFVSAARFCTMFDELRQYFRSRITSEKALPLAEQRRHFRQRFNDLLASYPTA